MLKLIFFAVLALVGTILSENDGSKFSDPHSLFGGSYPFGDPKIGQSAYVGHLSTDVHIVGLFMGFLGC